MVDAAHVAAATRGGVLWVQREGIDIHEAIWNVRVELIGLHQTEPDARLVREARLVVKKQRARSDRIAVVDARVVEMVVRGRIATAADGPEQLDDRMVEVELHAHLRVASLHLERLVLHDKDLVVVGCRSLHQHGGSESRPQHGLRHPRRGTAAAVRRTPISGWILP